MTIRGIHYTAEKTGAGWTVFRLEPEKKALKEFPTLAEAIRFVSTQATWWVE